MLSSMHFSSVDGSGLASDGPLTNGAACDTFYEAPRRSALVRARLMDPGDHAGQLSIQSILMVRCSMTRSWTDGRHEAICIFQCVNYGCRYFGVGRGHGHQGGAVKKPYH